MKTLLFFKKTFILISKIKNYSNSTDVRRTNIGIFGAMNSGF
jgi:hypothetical protein